MFKHILIPTDGSKLCNLAITNGVDFAKEINAKITGVTLTTPFNFFSLEATMVAEWMDRYTKDSKIMAARKLGVLKKAAGDASVQCALVHCVSEQPYEEIIKTAQGQGCHVIFMASHGRRGVRGLVMGGETHKVLTHTKIPVLVFR